MRPPVRVVVEGSKYTVYSGVENTFLTQKEETTVFPLLTINIFL